VQNERRRSPRINYYLPLKISSTDKEVVTETKNISAHGAYCVVDRDVEVMTKLRIIMHVPLVPKKAQKKFHKIECTGVIVRKEPLHQPSRREPMTGIGIFFYEISDRDRKYLDAFIRHSISHAQ